MVCGVFREILGVFGEKCVKNKIFRGKKFVKYNEKRKRNQNGEK